MGEGGKWLSRDWGEGNRVKKERKGVRKGRVEKWEKRGERAGGVREK